MIVITEREASTMTDKEIVEEGKTSKEALTWPKAKLLVVKCNIKKRKPIIDKKTGLEKPAPNPEFMLFEKCMRGDTSDNVFSAYPGVRKKGTKNKVGLIEAYEDKGTKGYNWNNMMLQRWVDHEGVEHRVLDDYTRNVTLCDLTAQPADIREIINNTIAENATPKEVSQVGMRLMKFCAKWDMQRIADQAATFAEPLQARYPQ